MPEITKRILHVEDNAGDARLVEIALQGDTAERYDLVRASSLEEAVGLVDERRFDAILLDLDLPDSQALDTLRRVVEAAPSVPVIVLSGRDEEATIAEAVSAGAQDFVLKDEVVLDLGYGRLPRTVDYAIKRNSEKLRLSRFALYDEMTGLPTRRLLRDRWQGAKARARREAASLGVLVIDLDDFKGINDGHGHAAGDAALTATAKCLLGSVRENDTVARIGGDEFVVLLETIGGIADAREVAAKLGRRLGETTVPSWPGIAIAASIGVAVCGPGEAGGLQDLIEQADRDMYRAKRGKTKDGVAATA